MPASVATTISDQIVDSAVGPMRVTQTTVVGFDVDDYVTTTVQSIAIAIKMYNLATTVNAQIAAGRPIVSIGGATVGGV